MITVPEIKTAIKNLPDKEYSKVRDWLNKYDMEQWDKRIEHDTQTKKLSSLKHRILKDFHKGKCTKI